jgi:uncharacterized protein DUF6064
MQLPFTVEQFFDVFGAYNTAIWPAQIIAYVLGILACGLAYRETKTSSRVISGILALSWLWIGAVYHIMHFAAVNPAARIFGAFFMLQGLLFFVAGTISGRLSFQFSLKPFPLLGAFFILYAMAIYPVLGSLFGHTYPRAPMFGVAPCPATIFTFGFLLWTTHPVPSYLLAIPLLWAFIGLSAAANLRVPQDYGLVVAGVLGTVLVLIQNRKAATLSRAA